jgi:hypothetical protein
MKRNKKQNRPHEIQPGNIPAASTGNIEPSPATKTLNPASTTRGETKAPTSWIEQAHEPIGLATIAIAITGIFQVVLIRQQVSAQRDEERARIEFSSMAITNLKPGEPLRCDVKIINSGKTLALDVVLPGTVQTSYIGLDDAIAQAKKSSSVPPPSSRALFPGIDVNIPSETTVPLTSTQVADIESGDLNVYLIGDITYRDIYKSGYRTHYCGRYVSTTKRFEDCGSDAN